MLFSEPKHTKKLVLKWLTKVVLFCFSSLTWKSASVYLENMHPSLWAIFHQNWKGNLQVLMPLLRPRSRLQTPMERLHRSHKWWTQLPKLVSSVIHPHDCGECYAYNQLFSCTQRTKQQILLLCGKALLFIYNLSNIFTNFFQGNQC